MLVMAGNQTTPIGDSNPFAGQPQANLWLRKTDDLWQFGGDPSGWGGPWWESPVVAGEPSVPYLMSGFGGMCLHLSVTGQRQARFTVELDFQGNGAWHPVEEVETGGGYACHVFEDGLSAHWVRLLPHQDCTATAQFFYS